MRGRTSSGAYERLAGGGSPAPPSKVLDAETRFTQAADTAVHPRSSTAPAGAHGILGTSPPMRQLLRRLEAAAPTDVPVLICGETGTGKELVASWVHRWSPRRAEAFVPVNAAAIPRDLVESELFGHTRGAFTGAVAARVGHCAEAHRGTLFLDEIGEMDLEAQAKLLRFLEDQKIRRVGAGRLEQLDVRLVAATNGDLGKLIEAGSFRRDLFYRLRVVLLELPPLRARRQDIPLLARSFLRRACRRFGRRFEAIDDGAMAALVRHPWPGNVRQLKSYIEEAVVLHDGRVLEASMLAPELCAEPEPAGRPWSADEALELSHLERALRGGACPEAAARCLGISRSTIYRKMKKYGLHRSSGGR